MKVSFFDLMAQTQKADGYCTQTALDQAIGYQLSGGFSGRCRLKQVPVPRPEVCSIRPPKRGEPLEFNHLGRFFADQGFQIFGILPNLATHVDSLMRTLERNHQCIVINRLGYKIRGFQLKAFYRQIHVTMPGDHVDFGFRILFLNVLQQLNAVHTRHFDIGHDDRRFLISI